MHANVGDHIHVNGRRVDGPVRDGTILEVRGHDGSPPYLVRWGRQRDPGPFLSGTGRTRLAALCRWSCDGTLLRLSFVILRPPGHVGAAGTLVGVECR
jgi:uncharacterized protein DUF1918